jgi:DNA primase
MEVLNDTSWSICREEEGMAIRGYNTGKVSTTQYAPNHIKSVIKAAGLRIVGESNNNLILYCPFHNNTHTPCFYISETNGAWLCFNPSCNESGNIVDLVKRVTEKNDYEAIRFISAKESEALDNFEDVMKDMFEEKPEFAEFPKETLAQLSNDFATTEDAKKYLSSRGIHSEACEYFEIGYSPKQDMVTVPVHSPDGIPVGIVGRSVSDKRFKNSTNLPKNKTLFNIHRAKKIGDHIIIVESSFDAIRIHQAGFPNVVATLGGHISKDNLNLLNRYFNKVTIMTDADQAGRELGMIIANKLSNKNILWSSYEYGKIYPHDAKDAGDMTDEEIKACIKNAVSDIEYRSWN